MPKMKGPDGSVVNVAFMSHSITLSTDDATVTKSVMVGTGPKPVETDEYPFSLFKTIIADKHSVRFDNKTLGMGDHTVTVESDGNKVKVQISIRSRIIP